MEELIRLENVWKSYYGGAVVHALRGVSISIFKGDFISILGPSGSGKSTFLHIASLLDKPTKGKVFFRGKEVSHLSDEELSNIRGKRIGFVFQAFNLIPNMTALENVELPLMIQGFSEEERRKRALSMLEKLGLKERIYHFPSQLSGGQKQRVAIARALIVSPDVVFADEPTGNLDSKSGKEVIKIFKKLNKEGKTLVIVTHDPEVAKVAKKIFYIRDGQIIKVEDKNKK